MKDQIKPIHQHTMNQNQPSFSSKQKLEMEELSKPSNNHVIWDCGSDLYDSFERDEFQKHLHSALVARTLSMPHLSDRRPPPLSKKQASKISRSFQRLIRAIFKPKSYRDSVCVEPKQGFYDAIPEVSEFDVLSPEIRRSTSARFTSSASLRITCS